MRGRTNYTGGAIPVINGEIKDYEIAAGSTINKGDFVELTWDYTIDTFVGYKSSAQRVIKLSSGTYIIAIRASIEYNWNLYAVDLVDGVPVVKSIFTPTIGSGTVKTSEDLQLIALEDNRFAYSGVRSDNYLGVAVVLMKYENGVMSFLSKQYYSDKDKFSTNPKYSPLMKGSNNRLIATWGSYFHVLSYANDTLTMLTEEVFSATGIGTSNLSNNFFFSIPGVADVFLAGIEHEDTTSGEETLYVLQFGADNTVTSLSYVEDEYGGSKPMPNNFAFVTDTLAVMISGYNKGSAYGQYANNRFRLYKINDTSVIRLSEVTSEKLNGMPSTRNVLQGGGAIAGLGNGFFVMIEGTGTDGVIYLSLGYVSELGEVTIKDFIEVKDTGFYGTGLILVSEDYNCCYIERNVRKNNTSSMKFKIVDMEYISLDEDKVYIKEYSKRAEGFANQSGIGGDIIEIYVPKSN